MADKPQISTNKADENYSNKSSCYLPYVELFNLTTCLHLNKLNLQLNVLISQVTCNLQKFCKYWKRSMYSQDLIRQCVTINWIFAPY